MMHLSIEQYLEFLYIKRHAPATLKVVSQDLTHFVAKWECTRQQMFDPVLLRYENLCDWRLACQRDRGAAPAIINHGLASLHDHCQQAIYFHLVTENPVADVQDVSSARLAQRLLSTEEVNTLFRVSREEKYPLLRAKNEALLAILIYTKLQVQEACNLQLRDLALGDRTIIVQSGMAKKARRVSLHPDAMCLLHPYLVVVRCSEGLPTIGSDLEEERLLVGIMMMTKGQPTRIGVTQRVTQRTVLRLGQLAAQQPHTEIQHKWDIIFNVFSQDLHRMAETVTPRMLRCSLHSEGWSMEYGRQKVNES